MWFIITTTMMLKMVIAMVGLMERMMRKESHQGLKAPTVSKG